MALGIEVDISPGDFVLDVDPASLSKGVGAPFPIFGPWSTPHCARWRTSSAPQKGRAATEFAAHFYGGQTAGCIEMPLGMEVGLSPGDFLLAGAHSPLPKRGQSPKFHPTSIVAKRLHG